MNDQSSPASEADTPLNKFSRAFWIANGVELLERAAWYGVFVVLTLYLSRILGYSDVEAATTSGVLSAGLYFLPTFSGAYADRIGFRNALLFAFGLLTIGYGSMWVLPTIIESAGLATYGRKVIATVGEQITHLTPSRGFAAELAAAQKGYLQYPLCAGSS